MMEWMRRWGEGFDDGAGAFMWEIIRRADGTRKEEKKITQRRAEEEIEK